MHQVKTGPLKQAVTIKVPGSKSYTHRMFIAAALSDGPCRVTNPLRSEDTLLTLDALKQLGVSVEDQGERIIIRGNRGRLASCDKPVYLANAGTSMRLLSGVVVLGQGDYVLTGTPRMCERPMQALLDSLQLLGVAARSQTGNGCPPVIIPGGQCRGGSTRIDCSISSQYLSGLLLCAPCLEKGISIEVISGPVSRPYIDMTVDIMEAFGITINREGYTHFDVPGGQTYRHNDHIVEPDGSQAGYFWAAAAITGARVAIRGVTQASRQGDVGLAEVFGRMGCRLSYSDESITVTGGDLEAVTVDMGHMPDMVPTLAVVAAFARGTTVIKNVAHLRAKESDRLAAVCRELDKMGIRTACTNDELRVVGGSPQGAVIETYDDHRIAMSFAVAGLKVPGIVISNPDCVAKSFPDYWDVFEELYL